MLEDGRGRTGGNPPAKLGILRMIRWMHTWLIPTSIALFLSHSFLIQICDGADLAIQIPVSEYQDPNGQYRLDYEPPIGFPQPNTTFRASDISNAISFSRGLPGTKYSFKLHYTNDSIHDWLTWTASITTTPEPPSNLSAVVKNGKTVVLNWDPPEVGGYSKFKIRLIPFSDDGAQQGQIRSFIEDKPPFTLRDLVSGAYYQTQVYTIFENKESLSHIERNFTTKPNTPGRFIVWYRNETTLLVLWQPPYPAGVFTGYKVQIEPQDAVESVLYVHKEGEPPGPAQAAFNNLIPGRAYNISVETVSYDQISTPTVAQYRTVPLRPGNISFDAEYITPTGFKVSWLPPTGLSEFDRYQAQVQVKKPNPVTVLKESPPVAIFDKGLEPGQTYSVVVKTFSGKVASWPTQANVTTRPLPVINVHNYTDNEDDREDIVIRWQPHPASKQDHYKITSQEAEAFGGDVNAVIVDEPKFRLSSLSPGRNYSISIQAVSNGMESDEETLFQATRPSSPIVENLTPVEKGLVIAWKSDVTSRQDMYLVEYIRNDTGEMFNMTTFDLSLSLTDLYPGAAYNIQLFAVSHGLLSEKHTYFQTVFPNPPRNLTALRVSMSSIHIRWLPPVNSLYSGYILKFRTNDNNSWAEMTLPTSPTDKEVTHLVPGEKYIMRVNTISYRTESSHPQQIIQTVRPSGVVSLRPDVDSSNITLQWDRPEGRIEAYDIRWNALDPIPGRVDLFDDEFEPDGRGSTIRGEKIVEQESWDEIVRIPIAPLMSGVAYSFRIGTTSHGMRGDEFNTTIRTLPLITSEVVIVNKAEVKDRVTLTYTATPSSISLFDRYRFELSDPSIPAKEKLANETDRKVTFDGLVPGRLYNFTIWTVSKDVTSRPLQRTDRLHPETIVGLNATSIGADSLTLVWDAPAGDYDAFEVQFLTEDSQLVNHRTLHPSITIRDLRPFRNYTFTVTVRSGSESTVQRHSHPVSATFSTKESTPEAVRHFKAISVLPDNITFEWALPQKEHNGILKAFVINYGIKDKPLNGSRSFAATETSGTIIGLQPGVTYNFQIEAQTRVGSGPPTTLTERMPIWAPPTPDPGALPEELSRTSATIKIRFRNNYFSNKYGDVKKFTVIVAEEKEPDDLDRPFRSWADVQSYTRWPPFQVLDPFNPFEDQGTATFEIGDNRSCSSENKNYCNGPLRAGRTYFVKIRAFTADDKYSDTSYATMTTDQDNTWLILCLALPMIIILGFIMCLVYVRRRRHGLFHGKRTRKGDKCDSASLPESIVETSRLVKLKDFGEHFRHMSADSDFRFSEEFEELKRVGRDQPCIAADLPVNRPKNRFTNILPYDQSRFKLQPTDDDEGSDYINANYVTGYNSPREFIVTQGPLPSTRDDFWRMCWESNSRAIAMLTRCVEKGREKCDRYWPSEKNLQAYYGDIQVTIHNISRYPDWIISEMKLQRGDQCRFIKHFHFTTWPDFGVPDPPQTLVRFVRAFRERVPPEQDRVRPIVVHCSAGVGRSGTFIALDRILQQIRKSDIVDIFGIVYGMRRERVWMVQTEQQYICIHQCLLAVLEGKENDIPPREIHANDGYEDDEGIAESGM